MRDKMAWSCVEDSSRSCRWSHGSAVVQVCSVLASVVRVAHKYQADRIVNAAADRIEKAFRYTPWLQDGGGPKKHAGKVTLTNSDVKITLPQDAVEIVNLAHLIDRPAWLPRALHLCCSVGDLYQLRRGITRDDGEVECLSDDDHARCTRAMPLLEALCCETALRTYDLKDGFPSRCCYRAPGRCHGVMKDRLVAFALKGMRADIFNFSCQGARYFRRDSTRDSFLPDDELCHRCHGIMLERVRALDARAVSKLPECFALDRQGKPVN